MNNSGCSRRLYVVFIMCSLIVCFSAGAENTQIIGMELDVSLFDIQSYDSPGEILEFDPLQQGQRFVTCDDFSYPDGTTIPGWTEFGGDWLIANQMAQSPNLGSFSNITNDSSYLNGDGCVTVSIDYGQSTTARFGAAMLWYQNENTHLIFKIQDNNYIGYFDAIGLYQNGSGLFQQGFNFGTNPIIQLEVVGTDAYGRVDVDRDGTFDHEFIQTVAPQDGLSGIMHWNGDCFFDDFCYGDECGGGVPTPTPTVPPTPTPTVPPTPTVIPCNNDGDVNLDDAHTSTDAQWAFLIALGSMMPTFEQECAADCNGDMAVTAGDAQEIFLAVLGSGSCIDPM